MYTEGARRKRNHANATERRRRQFRNVNILFMSQSKLRQTAKKWAGISTWWLVGWLPGWLAGWTLNGNVRLSLPHLRIRNLIMFQFADGLQSLISNSNGWHARVHAFSLLRDEQLPLWLRQRQKSQKWNKYESSERNERTQTSLSLLINIITRRLSFALASTNWTTAAAFPGHTIWGLFLSDLQQYVSCILKECEWVCVYVCNVNAIAVVLYVCMCMFVYVWQLQYLRTVLFLSCVCPYVGPHPERVHICTAIWRRTFLLWFASFCVLIYVWVFSFSIFFFF